MSVMRFGDMYEIGLIPLEECCPPVDWDSVSNPSLASLERARCEVCPEAVQARVKQLRMIGPLSSDAEESLRLQAVAIETAIYHLGGLLANFWMRKKSREIHSFALCFKKAAVILFKNKNEFFVCEGADKKVWYTVLIPYKFDLAPRFEIRKTSIVKRTGSTIDTLGCEETASRFLHELSVTWQMPYIPEVILSFQYTRYTSTELGSLPVLRVVSIEKMYENLTPLIVQIKDYALLVTISAILARQLAWNHGQGRIHGDFKQTNAVYQIERGAVRASCIDWSFSCGPRELRFPLTEGYYGSIEMTPPELFGAPLPFTGDIFKVESWAFGAFLCDVFLGKRLPWAGFLKYHFDNEIKPSREDRDQLYDQIKLYLGRALPGETEPGLCDIVRLIRGLFAISPELRLSMHDAAEELDRIYRNILRDQSGEG